MASGTRTLGFMFADLRGYTRFIDKHGDAAATELVRDYRRIVRTAVDRHGGTEVTTEGDSFFVVFESVSSAVLCGIAVLAEAGANDPPIPFGVGFTPAKQRPGSTATSPARSTLRRDSALWLMPATSWLQTPFVP